MKKIAFFLAVFISLNATAVVRRPEEEEGQAIVQHDNHPLQSNKHSYIIQLLTNSINHCFYAITKEGIFHRISWERISEIINKQQKNKVTRIVYNMQHEGDRKLSEIQII